jgi:hypothetical protein
MGMLIAARAIQGGTWFNVATCHPPIGVMLLMDQGENPFPIDSSSMLRAIVQVAPYYFVS